MRHKRTACRNHVTRNNYYNQETTHGNYKSMCTDFFLMVFFNTVSGNVYLTFLDIPKANTTQGGHI